MNIVPSNREPSVVQRWLKKLIEANKERDEEERRDAERRKKRESYKRKPKPRPKPEPKKKKVAAAVVVDRDRKKEVELAKRNFEQSKERGFVYLMRSGNGYYKIGISKNAKSRLYGLQRQFPIAIEIVHKIASNNYRNVEKYLHRKFSHKRAEYEWFKLEAEDIQWITSLQDCELDWILGEQF